VIPQNKIINAYLHDKITAEMCLQMPLCMISDADKHVLESDWQQSGNWKYPFRRYVNAGFDKKIISVDGKEIDLVQYTLEDHFRMLGIKVDS